MILSSCCKSEAWTETTTDHFCHKCRKPCDLEPSEPASNASRQSVVSAGGSVQTSEIELLLKGWEELSAVVAKEGELSWSEKCTLGAGRHTEIAKVLPYIRSLESRLSVAVEGLQEAKDWAGRMSCNECDEHGEVYEHRKKIDDCLSKILPPT
jgi:hypothetical protein